MNLNEYDNFDPMYKLPKKNGGRKIGKSIAKGVLAVALVATISVSSIMGYVFVTDGGATVSPDTQGGANVTNTVYLPTHDQNAMTSPQIFEKVAPSVVSITSTMKSAYGQSGTGTGTGIIMSEDGYIMTNDHVITGAEKVTVTLNTGESYDAKVIGSDPNTDIGVLKIEATDLSAATFGDSSKIVTGEPAIVIGNPLGIQFAETMTQGIISAPSREVAISQYVMTLIQVDAAINPGNSGGPLINSVGEVIGVINSKIMADQSSSVEGIGFAIPIEVAKNVADDLIEFGYVTDRPMLGISVQSLSPIEALQANMEPGAIVREVTPGGAAEKGGVLVGDKIIAFNGTAVESFSELNYEKDKCKPGDKVKITVVRNGNQMELTLTLQSNGK